MSASGIQRRVRQGSWPQTGRQSHVRWTFVVWALVFLVLAVLGFNAQADPAATISPVPAAGAGATFVALVRVIGALAVVFAAFFGGLWLWRNWQRVLLRQGSPSKLAIIEGKSLGPRHTLYVIGYEQQRMLVAASSTGVTMLTALPSAEPVPERSIAPAAAAPSPGFAALLLRSIAQRS